MAIPFFSVIITTYNRPKLLIRAIESVMNQIFQDFEIIIINDGSKSDYSNVETFISSYPNKIKYFYKQNEERSVARNFGVQKSSGQFICFLDDDDYYLQNHLQVLYDEIQRQMSQKAIYHTYSNILNQDGTWSKYDIQPKDPHLSEQEYYLTGGIMTMNCSCFAREILIEFPYLPQLKMAEDSNQRLRALSKYSIHRIPEYTSVYDFSESSTNEESISNLLEFIKTWKITFSDPIVKPYIQGKIKRKILAKCYILIIQNSKLISWTIFFKYSFLLINFGATKYLKHIIRNGKNKFSYT